MWKTKTHGMTGTRIYKMWHNMRSRCKNPNASKYYLYGGKGIKVCNEWKNSFINFYNWATKNGYKDNLTIDRIDSNKNYEPNNCKFSTYEEQNSHLKSTILITFNNETHTIKDWSKITKISVNCLSARYLRDWSIKRMLTTKTINSIKRDKKTGKFLRGGDVNVKEISARHFR